MIPFRLEYVIEETLRLKSSTDGSRERRVIKDLTGLQIPVSEAREVWSAILLHKWYLGERLNRDVGLRTAAVDYLENIAPPAPLARGSKFFPKSARLKLLHEKI
jgi:hypothetical protein